MNEREKELQAFRRRADAAGIDYEISDGDDDGIVEIVFPNGGAARAVVVEPARIGDVLARNFEQVRFLGRYEAIVDGDLNIVEANLRSGGSVPPYYQLRRIVGTGTMKSPRLRVESGLRWMEISDSSEFLSAISNYARPRNRPISLKIPVDPGISTDDAITVLEEYSSALFLDMDMQYGELFGLTRDRPSKQILLGGKNGLTPSPSFPRNSYEREPAALYLYGREAASLPLLEYLAYYQAIEYSFPHYLDVAAVQAIRTEVAHPAFDSHDDNKIRRLISLAQRNGKGPIAEREQLATVIEACVDEEWLANFITSSTEVRDHFCANKQVVSGATKIDLTRGKVRSQVAARIYDIRCRIVHAKADANGSGVELLLPSSPEADALGNDIRLVRLIAQRVLVSRAQAL